MKRLLPLFLILLLGCGRTPDFEQPIILISIDGFRADYLERLDLPNLESLADRGVYAPEGMEPVFPTKTFPNHYSIATGLYPANHGIVANTMYDPERDSWFRIADRNAVEDSYWWEGEPIWVTAELQGQTSATYFWVGSEAPVKGVQPTYWYRHDASVPGQERVDQVLRWLDLPVDERPSVITLYFSDVDTYSHRFGPFSDQAIEQAEKVDRLLGDVIQGLAARAIDANLIVVSDHGMADVDPDKVSFLEDYVDLDDGLFVTYSPVVAIRPERGRTLALRRGLADVPGLRLLGEDDLEDRQYTGHDRIPEVIAVADDGWTVYSTREFAARNDGPPLPGNHGYDSTSPDMRALFVAAGPAFQEGQVVEPFENVHLYNLMAHIAGLDPAPNDGDFDVVQPFLR